MGVIVDTNIIVPGLISHTGPPGKIVDALLQGFLVPVMSQATLAELEAVLMRPRLRTLFERADAWVYRGLFADHLRRERLGALNCARPTRAFGGRALREQRELPVAPAS